MVAMRFGVRDHLHHDRPARGGRPRRLRDLARSRCRRTMDAELSLRFNRHAARSRTSGSSSRASRLHARGRPAAPSASSASWRTGIGCRPRATVDALDVSLFDYQIRNDGPIRLAFENNTITAQQLKLAGKDTRLEVTGGGRPHGGPDRGGRVGRRESGHPAGVLHGRPQLRAAPCCGPRSTGRCASPSSPGRPTITDGRIRHMSLPQSLQAINGRVAFAGDGIRLEDLTAQLAGGKVRFGGRVGMNGYTIGQLSAVGHRREHGVPLPRGLPLDARRAARPGRHHGRAHAPRHGDREERALQQARSISSRADRIWSAERRRPPGAAAPRPRPAAALRRPDPGAVVAAHREQRSRTSWRVPTWRCAAPTIVRSCTGGRRSSAARRSSRASGTSCGTAISTSSTRRRSSRSSISRPRRSIRVPGQTYVVNIQLVGTLRPGSSRQLTSDPPLSHVEIALAALRRRHGTRRCSRRRTAHAAA